MECNYFSGHGNRMRCNGHDDHRHAPNWRHACIIVCCAAVWGRGSVRNMSELNLTVLIMHQGYLGNCALIIVSMPLILIDFSPPHDID